MSPPQRMTPKSARTRAAIEAAAGELFALSGFERTTVREIARRADIDPAMIIRYYGSKDALFARVAEPDLRIPNLDGVETAQLGEALVRHFLSVWEGDSGAGLPVLLRSAASNEEAAAKLREVFRDQVMPAIARIGDPATASQRAALVACQVLGLAMARYILKLPPVVAMSPDTLAKEIGRCIQLVVASPHGP